MRSDYTTLYHSLQSFTILYNTSTPNTFILRSFSVGGQHKTQNTPTPNTFILRSFSVGGQHKTHNTPTQNTFTLRSFRVGGQHKTHNTPTPNTQHITPNEYCLYFNQNKVCNINIFNLSLWLIF